MSGYVSHPLSPLLLISAWPSCRCINWCCCPWTTETLAVSVERRTRHAVFHAEAEYNDPFHSSSAPLPNLASFLVSPFFHTTRIIPIYCGQLFNSCPLQNENQFTLLHCLSLLLLLLLLIHSVYSCSMFIIFRLPFQPIPIRWLNKIVQLNLNFSGTKKRSWDY